MRNRDSNHQLWHFIPVKPGDEATARRWNLVIILILALLVLGVLTLAIFPQAASNNSAPSNITSKT